MNRTTPTWRPWTGRSSSTPSTRSSGSPVSLSTSRGGGYNTGLAEQDVLANALEDGQAAVLDPAVVGVNSHPHAVDALVHGHDAAVGVIGHDSRGDLRRIDHALAGDLAGFAVSEQAALEANGRHEAAERQKILKEQQLTARGLTIPDRYLATVILGVGLVLLFGGEWALNALGFQQFGLSDRPWLAGLGFTDELHWAALSAVLAIIILGELAGTRLRTIEYLQGVYRGATGAQRRQVHPPALTDYLLLAGFALGAVAGVVSLSMMRASYLREQDGAASGGLAFFGVQLVILLAAMALGYWHHHPEGAAWKTIAGNAATALRARDTTVAGHTATVHRINAAIDQRQAVLAQAGHHVRTDAANVNVQHALYKRSYLLAQPEPATDALFGDHLTPSAPADADLLANLIGITALPVVAKVTTDRVTAALEASRVRLENLRARIDQVAINALDLPQLQEEPGQGGDSSDTDNADDDGVDADSDVESSAGESDAAAATQLRAAPDPADVHEQDDPAVQVPA